MERTLYTTYLASRPSARSASASAEAHGKGMALQLNTLLDAGAIVVSAAALFTVDAAKFKAGGGGADARSPDDRGATATPPRRARSLAKMGVVRPEVQRVLDKLAARAGRHRAALRHRRQADRGGALSYFVAGILRIILLEASAALLVVARLVRSRRRARPATARSRLSRPRRAGALLVDQLRRAARRRQPRAPLGAVPLLLRLQVPARGRLLQPLQGDHPRRPRVGAAPSASCAPRAT